MHIKYFRVYKHPKIPNGYNHDENLAFMIHKVEIIQGDNNCDKQLFRRKQCAMRSYRF